MNREMQVRRVITSLDRLILSAKVTEAEEIKLLEEAKSSLGIIAAYYKTKGTP